METKAWVIYLLLLFFLVAGMRIYQLVGRDGLLIVMMWSGVVLITPWHNLREAKDAGEILICIAMSAAFLL